MMKDGMPMRVMPNALTAPSAKHAANAAMIATLPGSGMLSMLTLASCMVKNATTIPVALAMAATLRSISAHRMTKVSPTAMIPVTEICCRMLARLSAVAKDGLARLNIATSTSRVASGAMLRSWFRSQSKLVIDGKPSCSGEQPVLADRLPSKFAGDRATLHHQDAVSQRQHRLGLGGDH